MSQTRSKFSAALTAAIVCLMPVAANGEEKMEKEFVNPQPGFSQVAKVTVNGVTTIYVSGQVGMDADGNAGDDLAAQAEIAFKNVLAQLDAVGASKSDIVKTNVYIVDIDPERVQAAGRAQYQVLQLDPAPASTWVGVTGLVRPDLLIEVEATAIVAAAR